VAPEEYLTDCELLRVRVEELTTEVTKVRGVSVRRLKLITNHSLQSHLSFPGNRVLYDTLNRIAIRTVFIFIF